MGGVRKVCDLCTHTHAQTHTYAHKQTLTNKHSHNTHSNTHTDTHTRAYIQTCTSKKSNPLKAVRQKGGSVRATAIFDDVL